MDQRFEQLLNRLEACVAKQEAMASQQPGQAVPAGPKSKLTKQWEKDVVPKVKPFQDATAALGVAQVTKAVEQWITLIDRQPAMFSTMDAHMKPADLKWAFAANGEVWSAIDTVKAKDFKAPPNHL
jgi:hypothetical protein